MAASRAHLPEWRHLRVAEGAVLALVLLCPLALGGAPAWVAWPLCALSFAALLGACWPARPPLTAAAGDATASVKSLPLVGWALLVAAGACALQLVPLPAGLLDRVSPPAAAWRDLALAPLGLSTARPISLDPPSTSRELAKHLSYLALFIAVCRVAVIGQARRRLLAAVALSGVLLALIGLGHLLAGAQSLFGARAFDRATPTLLTPFGNPNHLAGYLTLSSTLCLGFALSSTEHRRSGLWAVAFLVSAVALWLSLSRGGILFFVLTQVLFALLLLSRRPRRGEDPGWRRHLPVVGSRAIRGVQAALALVAVFALAVYLGPERLEGELQTIDSAEKLRLTKLQHWPMLAAASVEFARAGMGRGAFEVGFARFQTDAPFLSFTHAENGPFQLLTELGFPIGLAVLGLGAAGLLQLLRRREPSTIELAGLAGVVGLLGHDLLDFSLELPAAAVALWVVLGVLARGGEARAAPPRLFALAIAAAALAVLATWSGRHTLRGAEQELATKLRAGATGPELEAAARPLLDRHPSDHVLYALVAQANLPERPGRALAFVNRALVLRPIDGPTHRLAARTLVAARRRTQAMLEYRLAHDGGDFTALEEGVRQARGVEELGALAGGDLELARTIADRLGALGRPAEALALVEHQLTSTEAGANVAPLWLLTSTLRARARDFGGARAALEHARRSGAAELQLGLARAELLSAQGDRAGAREVLSAVLDAHPGSIDAATKLAAEWLAGGDGRHAREVLGAARAHARRPAERARLLAFEAETFEREHRWASALDLYRTAARLAPRSPALHYAAARMLERMGRTSDALAALREGLRVDAGASREQHLELARELERRQR